MEDRLGASVLPEPNVFYPQSKHLVDKKVNQIGKVKEKAKGLLAKPSLKTQRTTTTTTTTTTTITTTTLKTKSFSMYNAMFSGDHVSSKINDIQPTSIQTTVPRSTQTTVSTNLNHLTTTSIKDSFNNISEMTNVNEKFELPVTKNFESGFKVILEEIFN